jgi:hypothetical protein
MASPKKGALPASSGMLFWPGRTKHDTWGLLGRGVSKEGEGELVLVE